MVTNKHLQADQSAQLRHAAPGGYAEADILRLSAFFRDNPNPILVFSPDGSIIRVNPAAERLRDQARLTLTDLLPVNHVEMVQACLAGRVREQRIEVTVGDRVFMLTYHGLASYKLGYLSAIDVTRYRQAEMEFLQSVNHALELAKRVLLAWQPTGLWA